MPSVSPPRPVQPAAVSVLSAAVVGGEPVAATVLGVHGPALYLGVAGRVLPVVTSAAVPLPTALRLAVPAGGVPWGVVAGDVVPVGDGRVALPGVDLVVSRTWRPARVRRATASALPTTALRRRSARGHDGDRSRPPAEPRGAEGTRDWLVDGIHAVLAAVGRPGGRARRDRGTRHGDDGLSDAVSALLGRGQGLTPSGDDALAGALLVAHATGAAAPLAAAVRARLGATTAVSAALLDAAADGFAARAVVTLVDAALAGDDVAVAAALPTVLAMGHSSGGDLVTGVAAALEAVAAPSWSRPGVHRAVTPSTDQTPTGRSAA